MGRAPRRPRRVLLAGTALAALAAAAAVVPGTPALASHHNPTSHELSASRAAVAEREQQVKDAATALGHAEGRLQRLNTASEVAFEAYDGARVKLAAARQSAAIANRVLTAANRQLTKGQQQVDEFARQVYETGGISTVDAFLTPGGPRQLVSRVGALAMISNSQRTTLQRFDAARVYHGVVAQQANAVAAKATAATTAAAQAKAAAVAAVARQHTLLKQLQTQRAQFNTLLAQARSRANQLQSAHLAAVARARAAAAAAAAAPVSGLHPYVNVTGDLSGTISAATGLAAVRVAERQIGKPYQWGGAGPNTFDCSGLVMWSYDQVGVHLDHWTGDQWNEGAHIGESDLRPGDLLFFAYDTSRPSTIHHVGMYIGNGQMVEAPHTGANVQISNTAGRTDYIGAVRPFQR